MHCTTLSARATVTKQGVIGNLWSANPNRLISPAAPAKVLVLLFVTSFPQASQSFWLPRVFHVTEKRLSWGHSLIHLWDFSASLQPSRSCHRARSKEHFAPRS